MSEHDHPGCGERNPATGYVFHCSDRCFLAALRVAERAEHLPDSTCCDPEDRP